jgi:hypothetical protein
MHFCLFFPSIIYSLNCQLGQGDCKSYRTPYFRSFFSQPVNQGQTICCPCYLTSTQNCCTCKHAKSFCSQFNNERSSPCFTPSNDAKSTQSTATPTFPSSSSKYWYTTNPNCTSFCINFTSQSCPFPCCLSSRICYLLQHFRY